MNGQHSDALVFFGATGDLGLKEELIARLRAAGHEVPGQGRCPRRAAARMNRRAAVDTATQGRSAPLGATLRVSRTLGEKR